VIKYRLQTSTLNYVKKHNQKDTVVPFDLGIMIEFIEFSQAIKSNYYYKKQWNY